MRYETDHAYTDCHRCGTVADCVIVIVGSHGEWELVCVPCREEDEDD